jgi:hypothetical protein
MWLRIYQDITNVDGRRVQILGVLCESSLLADIRELDRVPDRMIIL